MLYWKIPYNAATVQSRWGKKDGDGQGERLSERRRERKWEEGLKRQKLETGEKEKKKDN